MSKITYTDKVALNQNSNVQDIYKVNPADMNEIKNVVNANSPEEKLVTMTGTITLTQGQTIASKYVTLPTGLTIDNCVVISGAYGYDNNAWTSASPLGVSLSKNSQNVHQLYLVYTTGSAFSETSELNYKVILLKIS